MIETERNCLIQVTKLLSHMTGTSLIASFSSYYPHFPISPHYPPPLLLLIFLLILLLFFPILLLFLPSLLLFLPSLTYFPTLLLFLPILLPFLPIVLQFLLISLLFLFSSLFSCSHQHHYWSIDASPSMTDSQGDVILWLACTQRSHRLRGAINTSIQFQWNACLEEGLKAEKRLLDGTLLNRRHIQRLRLRLSYLSEKQRRTPPLPLSLYQVCTDFSTKTLVLRFIEIVIQSG